MGIGIGVKGLVHGEFLIMRLLVSETIPVNVTATQNSLDLQVIDNNILLFNPRFTI